MNYGNWTNSNCNQSCDCQFIFKTWISSQTSDKELTQVTQEKNIDIIKKSPHLKEGINNVYQTCEIIIQKQIKYKNLSLCESVWASV